MNYILTLEEFTIRGKSSNKVLVFDIDDTLIKSNANVYVKKNGEITKKLDSQEFNNYKLNDGEEFDFEEFRDLNILLASEIKPYFNTLKREYDRGVHISILTARTGKDMIHDFFIKKAGIDIHPNLIFTSGDDESNDTVAEKKAKCIKKLAEYGYKILVFFDDNVDNLKKVKSIGDNLGLKIHLVKA